MLRYLIPCLTLSDDRARRSPRKLPTSLKKEERKWVPPKFLPHKYDVKLKNEDKVSCLLESFLTQVCEFK